MGEGAHVGLLHDVLGLGVVADDAAGDAEEAPVVALHQRPHRAFVAAAGQVDQGGVVEPGQARRGPGHAA